MAIYNVLLIIQIVISAGIIVLVLMQQGKGADAGAAFGSGASGTVFGSQGSSNFMSRTTAILATLFFLNCLALAFLASERVSGSDGSLMDSLMNTAPTESVAPQGADSDVPPAPGQSGDSDVPQPSDGSDVPPPPSAAEGSDAPAAADSGDVPAAPVSEEKAVQDDKQ